MMFSRLGVLTAFYDLRYFQLTMGLSGCKLVLSQGKSVLVVSQVQNQILVIIVSLELLSTKEQKHTSLKCL